MEFVPETVAPGDIPWSGFYLGFIVWRRNSLSDLDDFSDIVNYIYCNEAEAEAGHFEGKLLPLKYPR